MRNYITVGVLATALAACAPSQTATNLPDLPAPPKLGQSVPYRTGPLPDYNKLETALAQHQRAGPNRPPTIEFIPSTILKSDLEGDFVTLRGNATDIDSYYNPVDYIVTKGAYVSPTEMGNLMMSLPVMDINKYGQTIEVRSQFYSVAGNSNATPDAALLITPDGEIFSIQLNRSSTEYEKLRTALGDRIQEVKLKPSNEQPTLWERISRAFHSIAKD